jgi:type VI protein secretion system component Hcp
MANEPEHPGETSENGSEIEDLQVTDQDAAEQVKGGAEQVREAISLNYERIQVKYTGQ